MKKFVTVALAATLALSFASASAQERREAGIFADEFGTQSVFAAVAFVAFDIYAVGFGLDGNVFGYEFSTLGLDGLIVIGAFPTVVSGGGVNIGNVPGEFIVGTGACLTADPTGPFVLARLNVGSFAGANLTDKAICITGSDPSSFEDFGSAPGWLRCDGTLEPFGVAQNGGTAYPNGCLILNATQEGPVSTDAASFGEMKARF